MKSSAEKKVYLGCYIYGRKCGNGHVLLSSGPGGWSFCSCGAKTGPVGTFTRQREWHRQHKRDARKRDGKMGWIEHGDASYIEMKNRDIVDLRAKVAALGAENGRLRRALERQPNKRTDECQGAAQQPSPAQDKGEEG